MEGIVGYIIELNIALTIFFFVYLVAFRRDGNFNNRRAFLLFSMIASLLIPLLNFQISTPAASMYTNVISLEGVVITGSGESAASGGVSFPGILFTAYLLISGFFMLKLILGILRIYLLALRAPKVTIDGKTVAISNTLHASSFFHLIFLDPSKLNPSDCKLILRHEHCHVSLVHSLDRILSEFIVALNWFNPLSWIIRRSIVVNHEYQADNKVIERGTDQISYQLSILNQYIGSASITNQFSNQIKNRIKMLNKNYKKGSSWKSLLLIPVSMILLLFMACNNDAIDDAIESDTNKSAEKEIFYVVEEMPQWAGGEELTMEMRKFIAKNLIYPPKAIEAGAEGKVFVQFLVTETGKVVVPDPSELPPPHPAELLTDKEVVVVTYRPLDNQKELPDDEIIQLFKDESKRVVELMPNLIPGKQRGKAVNVMFTMPIIFKMQ